jgi:hypothetical protein
LRCSNRCCIWHRIWFSYGCCLEMACT